SEAAQLRVLHTHREGQRARHRPMERPALELDPAAPPARQEPRTGGEHRVVTGLRAMRGAGAGGAGAEIDVGLDERDARHREPAAHATRRSRRPRGRSSASPAPGATGPASAVSGATSKPNSSNEYYVVVIDAVEGLDLQADRTSDLCLELAEGGGFLVQEAIHDVLVGQYQQLATGKLSALSHNLPKNLVAHGFGRADEAAPFTAWTRLTHHMFQALAGALTGHLHQPEGREAHDVGLGAIAGEGALEGDRAQTHIES